MDDRVFAEVRGTDEGERSERGEAGVTLLIRCVPLPPFRLSSSQKVYQFHRDHLSFVKAYHLEVRMTATRGWGLFAVKPLKEEQAIAVIGEVISSAEEKKREKAYLRRNQYSIFAKYEVHDHERVHSYWIDNTTVGNLARFINHSCKPNITSWSVSSGRQVALYTNRDIRPGEELTMEYDEDHTPRACILCRCGEENCRGKITAAQQTEQ